MPEPLASYRVFIASPGGLETERKAFRDLINAFNESDAIPRGACFIPVGWEVTLGGIGRPQSMINEEVERCDYFVMLLHNRWGSPPDSEDSPGPYRSGTEEEYHIALECYESDDKPMRQIVPFFKAVDAAQMADPGDQLKQVNEFRKRLESEKKLYFDTYDVPGNFKERLRCYLAQWLRDHEGGNLAKAGAPTGGPTPTVKPDIDAGDLIRPTPPSPSNEEANNSLVKQARKLADEGKLVEAESLFAKAIVRTQSPDPINAFGQFLMRIGRLSQAKVMFERVLELSVAADDTEWQACAYGNLGLIYQTRGNIHEAEMMHRKSLEIEEQFGRLEGMASDYANLSLIYETRGDLDEAEKMLRKSLEIDKKLGRLEGMANQYGNLGLIYRTRGDLDEAEKMLRKSLEIHEKLGRLEGMAITYGNLGLIYRTRGDLDEAEKMLRKSLEIDEKLGRLEGMANQYGNLGMIYQTRGDLDEAEKMYRKSLEIDEKLERLEGMASTYDNLGLIYQSRGDLDEAEKMHRKSLEIEEKLERLEGMASTYGNFGLIYQKRGNLDEAEKMFRKSLEVNEKIGRLEGIAIQYGSLGSLAEQRGKRTEAREWWIKSRDLFKRIGMPHMVEKVEGWLDRLPDKPEA